MNIMNTPIYIIYISKFYIQDKIKHQLLVVTVHCIIV